MRRLALALWTVSVWTPAMAHTPGTPPRRVAPAVEHRATAVPDRIVLTFAGDPRSTAAATWRTDNTVSAAVARVAPAADGPKFTAKARTVAARTTVYQNNLGTSHHHSATFNGLSPSTKYLYSVGDGVNWSEWLMFETAADGPEPFEFIYVGDAQNDIKAHWSRLIRQAHADAPKARFILHAGDLVNSGESDAEWGEWFYAGGWLHAGVPVVATPGNHEYVGGKGRSRLTRHWHTHFTLPANGPPGFEGSVYYFDFQGVRVVSLNSNETAKFAEQAAWLDGVLADNPNPWSVVTFHHPVYSTARNRDNAKLREAWQPIFDRHRVDLVLTGHDHSYGRSGPLTADNISEGGRVLDSGGTVYVVSVSGPKMYTIGGSRWMNRSGEGVQLYQVIRIDGPDLHYEARTATGELFDGFRLHKRPGRANDFVEEMSDPPGRRDDTAHAAGLRPADTTPKRGKESWAIPGVVAFGALLSGLAMRQRYRNAPK